PGGDAADLAQSHLLPGPDARSARGYRCGPPGRFCRRLRGRSAAPAGAHRVVVESDQHDLAGLAARSGACVRILQRPAKRRAEQLNDFLNISTDDTLVSLTERSRVTAGRKRDEGDECEGGDIVHVRAPALR